MVALSRVGGEVGLGLLCGAFCVGGGVGFGWLCALPACVLWLHVCRFAFALALTPCGMTMSTFVVLAMDSFPRYAT